MAKRRSNGEGTLRLRADGRWEMTIMDGFRDDGKRRFKTFYGKTQKEVKAKAKGYRDAKDSGLVVDVNYLFPEWANIWYENHKDNIAPTTQENYRYTLRILNEGFARYQDRQIVQAGQRVSVQEVLGGDARRIEMLAAEDFSYALAAEECPQLVLPGPGFVYAPAVEGAEAGFAYVLINGTVIGKVPVVYGATVEQEAEEQKGFWQKLFEH